MIIDKLLRPAFADDLQRVERFHKGRLAWINPVQVVRVTPVDGFDDVTEVLYPDGSNEFVAMPPADFARLCGKIRNVLV